MSNELEDIKKRLKALEKQDLLIAKVMSRFLCLIAFQILARTLKGEEQKSFLEFYEKKLEATKQEIADSQTVESTLDTFLKFYEEVVAYVAAAKVDTADKAMEIAHSFIKKYSPVALPMKAEREDDIWLVDIDVGALAVKIAKVKVDARTGDILSYEIPQK